MTNKLRDILGEGYIFLSVGAIGLSLSFFIQDIVSNKLLLVASSNEEPGILLSWSAVVVASLPEVFAGSLLVGFAISYLYARARTVWVEMKPRTIKKVAEFEHKVLETVKRRQIDDIVSGLNPLEAKELLPRVAVRAYGESTTHSDSFYTEMTNKYSGFFDPKEPYRANFIRQVIIRRDEGGKLSWHEDTSYEVTCEQLENCTEIEQGKLSESCHIFPLRYYTKLRISEIDPIDALKSAAIALTVDEETLFNSANDIRWNGRDYSADNEKVRIKIVENDYLEIEYADDLRLKKAGMRVSVSEISLLDPNDNVGIFRSKVPTKKARISVSLPDGGNFTEVIYGNRSIWNERKNPESTLVVDTNSWVPPGLMFGCVFKLN